MSAKKDRTNPLLEMYMSSTHKKKTGSESDSRYRSVRSRSKSKSTIERNRLLPEPLALRARFDLEAASGRKAPSPHISLQQSLVSKALTAELMIRDSCMVESKHEEIQALESEIKKLKKAISLQKTQKENNSGLLKDAIKDCSKLSNKIQKRIETYESVNKKKKSILASTESKIKGEDTRFDTIATNQSKLEAEISMLLSNSALSISVDQSASVDALVNHELIRKDQNESDIQRLTEEKRHLSKTLRKLDVMIQEVY